MIDPSLLPNLGGCPESTLCAPSPCAPTPQCKATQLQEGSDKISAPQCPSLCDLEKNDFLKREISELESLKSRGTEGHCFSNWLPNHLQDSCYGRFLHPKLEYLYQPTTDDDLLNRTSQPVYRKRTCKDRDTSPMLWDGVVDYPDYCIETVGTTWWNFVDGQTEAVPLDFDHGHGSKGLDDSGIAKVDEWAQQPSKSMIQPRFTCVLSQSGNSTQTVTLSGDGDGDTFTLTYDGQSTDPIAYDAVALTVQTALEGLFGTGNVTVTGDGPYVCEFVGGLAKQDVALMSGAVTTGTIVIAQTDASAGSRYGWFIV